MSVLSLIPEEKRNCLSRRESTETVYSGATVAVHPARVRRFAQAPRADRVLTQRVVSAKTHRIKLLQNQLADAQFHLVELNNENRLLRGLQKKQEVALDRLEKSSSSLPSLVTARDEESRVNRARLSDARRRLRDVSRALARRDRELQTLQDEHQHLLSLSNDKSLLEREKLQTELHQLRAQAEQQAEQLVVLQRQLALQEKNHRRQLAAELAKHRDTRHDLDQAISNADKLNSIIEMKEKYITNAMVSKHARVAMGGVKLPRPPPPPPPRILTKDLNSRPTCDSAVSGMSEDLLSKFSDNSRTSNINSSNDVSFRPRSVSLVRNNLTRPITPYPNITNKKPVKEELAKTIREGMSDLKIYDDEIDFTRTSEEDAQKKINLMKVELMKKLKSEERNTTSSTASSSRKSSGILKKSPELSPEHWPRNRSAQSQSSRRSSEYSVEFIESDQSGSGSAKPKLNLQRETSSDSFKNYSDRIIEKKVKTHSKADVDSYCQNIIQDIEKSNKIIDSHIQGFSSSRKESDKLIEELQVLDKMNGYINTELADDLEEDVFVEMNNNIDDLSKGDTLKTQRLEQKKIETETLKRAKPGKIPRSKLNSFGDSSLSNQDLLDDLLGKK